MARIRSLKPDHKSHRKVGPLTDRQYRLWVGMLTEADDEGRLVADTGQLRHQVFGYHPHVRERHVEEAVQALSGVGLICLYVVEGVRYAQFPSWSDHQVINKSVRSKLPPPLHSGNGHVVLPEGSGSTTVGREGSGREGSGVDVECAVAPSPEHSQISIAKPDAIGDAQASGQGPTPTRVRNTPPEALASESPTRVKFQVPTAIIAALNRAPRLGAVTRLRNPDWWQAMLRANRGVDFPTEVLKAEAYLVSHPDRHYKDLGKYLHGWIGRADRSS